MIGVRLSFSKPKTLLGCRELGAWMRREGISAGRKVGKKNIGWLSKQSNINGACMNILFVYNIKFSKNRSVCEFYALLL
jgi:hypothetical protein